MQIIDQVGWLEYLVKVELTFSDFSYQREAGGSTLVAGILNNGFID